MEQHPGLEGKANVYVHLATAGDWPFWILMSVKCEPSQSVEYVVCSFVHSFIHSSTFINASLEPEGDSGSLESGCETLQVLPRDLVGIYGRTQMVI